MTKILHVSAECYPVAKVGGLADVVGSLPKYQQSDRITSQVIMPYYEKDFTKNNSFSEIKNGQVALGDVVYPYKILKTKKTLLGFTLFLVKIETLTDRENVYGYEDDTERFMAFQKVVADFILEVEKKPSVIHCHDHHTGLIPFFISRCHKYEALKQIPAIFTIHNAQYQGNFSFDKLYYFPEYNLMDSGYLEWNQQINPLASGIKCAWRVTTVSPSYMKELQVHANGLEWLLNHESNKALGILNGVDPDYWNPKTDKFLKENYSLQTVAKGRTENKKWICKEFDLDPKLPLVAFIGRFVYEKGSDLLPEVIEKVFGEFNLNVNLLILGSGSQETTNQLNALREKYKGKYNDYIGYNEELSHIIYAGADFLLMPSRVEPCGLNQMYAMRYGMIPIVSKTGGLIDTIVDFDESEDGYGITINEINSHEISFGIQRAVDVYNNASFFNRKRKKIMKIDNSWDKSAKQYIQLYESLTTKQ